MGRMDEIRKKAAATRSSGITTKQEIEAAEKQMTQAQGVVKHQKLHLKDIRINSANDYNEEDTPETIAQLAADIERVGLLHNLVVSAKPDGTYLLLSGERRFHALKMLYHDPEKNAEGKYDTVRAVCYYDLNPLDEMIMLDSANLQVRGVGTSEKAFRRGMLRYVENLKQRYGISDAAAKGLLKKLVSGDERTIDRNFQLRDRLSPSLTKLLDEGVVGKYQCLDYTACPLPVQEKIYELLVWAQEQPLEEKQKKDFLNKTAALAATVSEEKSGAEMEEKLTAVKTQMEARLTEMQVKAAAPVENPAMKQKRKYIEQYTKLTEQVKKLEAPAKLRQIRKLEEIGDSSILSAAEELRTELERFLALAKGE